MLEVFVKEFDRISRRAGWSGRSLLGAAIAVQSWITSGGDHVDELLMLLSVHELLNATHPFVQDTELEVLMVQFAVDTALGDHAIQ